MFRQSEKQYAKGYYRILSRHTQIALSGDNRLSNNNMIVVGSSGTYKTTSIVTPNILTCQANYIVLDVKGELLRNNGNFLKEHGYKVRYLNFIDFSKSMHYNPFVYIKDERDVVNTIAAVQEALKPTEEIKSDPFWTTAPALYLQALFYLVWDEAREQGRYGTMQEVLNYANMELAKGEHSTKDNPTTALSEYLEEKKNTHPKHKDYPPVRDYMKLKSGATETVKSIIIIVNDTLKLFEIEDVSELMSYDEMRITDFAYGAGGTKEHPTNKKTALFLVVPDDEKQFLFIISLLYTQIFKLIKRIADTDFYENDGMLPIPLEFWMDEFYSGAKPAHVDDLMGVVRSRNISMIPILQSIDQLKALYPNDRSGILLDNCPIFVFMGCAPAALNTMKFISELLGEQTIDVASDGRSGKSGTTSYNHEGRVLMTPQEVAKKPRKDCIIFLEGENPIYDRKALPWEMPENIVPFQTAQMLKGKTGFQPPRHSTFIKERKEKAHINETICAVEVVENDEGFPKDAQVITENIFLFSDFRAVGPKKQEAISDDPKNTASIGNEGEGAGTQRNADEELAYNETAKQAQAEIDEQAQNAIQESL